MKSADELTSRSPLAIRQESYKIRFENFWKADGYTLMYVKNRKISLTLKPLLFRSKSYGMVGCSAVNVWENVEKVLL